MQLNMFRSTKPDSSNSSQLWCTAFWGTSGAANGLLRLSLDGQLSAIFWCPGNGSRLSRCRTGCCCIPKSHFSLFQISHLFFFPSLPLIVFQVWAKGETENSLAWRQQALVTSVPSALHVFCFVFFSPSPPAALVHLRGSETNVATCANKCGLNTHLHAAPVHMQACTLGVREISLPPVSQQGRALRSAQALPHNNKHVVGQMFAWQRCSLWSVVIAGILAKAMQPFHRTYIECICFCEIQGAF